MTKISRSEGVEMEERMIMMIMMIMVIRSDRLWGLD